MTSVDLYPYIRTKLTSRELTDGQIDLAFEEIDQVVKNYCQISVVPDALKFTVCNMMIDLLNYEYEVNRNPSETGVGDVDIADVTSFKEGDTSIQMGQSGSTITSMRKKAISSHKPMLDEITMNYTKQLNQFRRIW